MRHGRLAMLVVAAALAAGCAAPDPSPVAPVVADPPPASAPPPVDPPLPEGAARYRCEGERVLVVRLQGEVAHVQGLPQGEETLLLDAGGVTPQQHVFSNADVRMEIGLGDRGREAVFQLLQPAPSQLRCVAG